MWNSLVQGKKIFNAYKVRQSEDIIQEQSVIKRFIEELGWLLPICFLKCGTAYFCWHFGQK
jgi:hypothetical protein